MKSSEIVKGAEAFYTGTVQAIDFGDKVMVPVLKGQINLSKKEKVILTTYFRLFLQFRALKLLSEYRTFQSVMACSRSIFEQLLDLKLIFENKISSSVDKFYAFHEVEKFKRANEIVKFSMKNPSIKIETKIQQQLVNKKGGAKRIDKLKSKYWPKKDFIPHWSGLSVKKRAELIGKEHEALYYETYSMMSWYIHSGPSGHFYVDEDGLRIVFVRGHELSQSMFIEATVLVAKEFSLDKAVPNFYKSIEKLKLIPGVVLLKDREDIKEIVETIFND
jgi:hypothetical protein